MRIIIRAKGETRIYKSTRTKSSGLIVLAILTSKYSESDGFSRSEIAMWLNGVCVRVCLGDGYFRLRAGFVLLLEIAGVGLIL